MAKRPDPKQGLETRFDAKGVEHYRASVRIPGTNKKKRGRWTTNLAEARGERARLLAAQESLGEAAENPEYPTLAEALETWLTLCEGGKAWAKGGKKFAPKTLRDYRADVRIWINPAIGGMPVNLLRRSQIQALVDEVAVLRSGQKAKNVVTVLKTLYRYLLPRHDELQNPTLGLELPAGSPVRDVIVTPDEMCVMLDALRVQDRCAFAVAGMAGLRAGEIKALCVEDVILDDFDHEYPDRLIIHAGWDAVEGRQRLKHREEGEGRIVPIFRPLRPVIEAQLASLGPEVPGHYPLIPGTGRHGDRVGLGAGRDMNHLLVTCREAWGWERRKTEDGTGTEMVATLDVPLAPLEFRLHDARHSFASHLVIAGVDIATVAEWIGHRQASTTLDRYVHPLRRRGVRPADVREYLGV